MGNEYRPRQYLNRVLAASSSTHSARSVLIVMCWQAEFDRPEVTITKPQIAEMTGLTTQTVRVSLRLLCNTGSIEVLTNHLGGRGKAPTYRLIAPKGADYFAKGADYLPKGADYLPPSIDSIDSTGDAPVGTSERPAAGRGGSGIKREASDRARTWRRQQAEKREKAENPAPSLTPEEKAGIEAYTRAEIESVCEALWENGEKTKAERYFSIWRKVNDGLP